LLQAFIPSEFLLTLAHQTTELANKLGFNKDIDLRLCPRWDFNYGIYAYKDFIQSFLADLPIFLLPEVLENLASFPELFVFINYPRTESRNILLHSIMIHELGHLVDFQTGISTDILKKKKIKIEKVSFDELFKKELGKRSEWGNARVNEDDLRQELVINCSNIIEKWLKEFISDLVATHLLGPAYFFGLYEMSILTDDMHNYSESHPSSGIRLRVISEQLYERYLNGKNNNNPKNKKPRKVIKDKKVRQLLSRLYENLKKREEENEFAPADHEINYYHVVYNTILPKRVLLRKQVRQKISGFSYDVDQFNNEVEYLFKDIKDGVTPSEFRSNEDKENKPASFASILNVGWLAYFFGMDDFYSLVCATEDSDKLRALDNFNQLLFKAVESSHILQQWPKKE